MNAVLIWPLLKVGGHLIFDDYDFQFLGKPSQNTKVGVDAFLETFSDHYELVHQSYQVMIKKLSS